MPDFPILNHNFLDLLSLTYIVFMSISTVYKFQAFLTECVYGKPNISIDTLLICKKN